MTIEPVDKRPYDPYRPRKFKAPKGEPLPQASRPPASDWRKECDRLTEQIGKLVDGAQEWERKGKPVMARTWRMKAKRLANQRAAITKRNKGR